MRIAIAYALHHPERVDVPVRLAVNITDINDKIYAAAAGLPAVPAVGSDDREAQAPEHHEEPEHAEGQDPDDDVSQPPAARSRTHW